MPMYFPDLDSVKKCAEMMQKHSKPYTWIIPDSNENLPQARIELWKYFREVWQDKIQAMEIEQWVTEENYYQELEKWIAEEMKNAWLIK